MTVRSIWLWSLLLLAIAVGISTGKTHSSSSSTSSGTSTKSSGTADQRGKAKDAVPALVIGGNFTLNGRPCNLAQFDTTSKTWYTRFEPQLYLYGEATGEVNDLVVSPSTPYDTLYVVGSFDTICKTCQQLYCSVGFWNGDDFQKVGDGLCPRATDIKMKINTAALTPGGNFFVGGTFESRVWSGEKFVNTYNIAQYDTEQDSWLPLHQSNYTPSKGGGLGCNWCTVEVMSLAWNDRDKVLYIGGRFNMVNNQYIEAGLAVWKKDAGMLPFPGGGLTFDSPAGATPGIIYDGMASTIIYNDESRSMYVAGAFERIGGHRCNDIAVWREEQQAWACLFESGHSFSSITSLLYMSDTLFVAGMPSEISTWPANATHTGTYAVARMSQSPTVFPGKYETWGSGGGGHRRTSAEGTAGGISGRFGGRAGATQSNPVMGTQQFDGGFQLLKHSAPAASHLNKKSHLTAAAVAEARGSLSPREGQVTAAAAAAATTADLSSISDSMRSSSFSVGGKAHGVSGEDSIGDAPSPSQWPPQDQGNAALSDYRFYWEWLPGFSGEPAEINVLAAGIGDFRNSMFIGGKFSPPVIMWQDDPQWGASTSIIGSGEDGELQGVVTSIKQMQMAPPIEASRTKAHDLVPPWSGVGLSHTFTWGVVLVCVMLGVCLGIMMAIICHNQQYLNVPWLKDMVEGRNGISLTTLAGSYGIDMETEFKERFSRAMHARHLWRHHNLNIINPKEIVLHKIIGEGSYGRVWTGMWRSSQVAVKEFVFAQAAIAGGSLQRNDLIEEIIGEAAIISYLRHPRILHLYGCCLTSQAIWIVSELCVKGSLRQVLDDKRVPLPLKQRVQIAVDIAEGMLYLHTQEQPIIHRDLKSHNVFIQETASGELLPKIGDWGSARAVALHTGNMKTMTHGVGTACWLAPEVIKHAKGSKQSDVYAFGILLWELATRDDVHSGLSAPQIIAMVANDGLRPPVPRNCPWGPIMEKCWHETPEERLSFGEVVMELKEVLTRLEAQQGNSSGGWNAKHEHYQLSQGDKV